MSDELEQTRRLLDISQECVRELRAANARKQAWIDGVMAQERKSAQFQDAYGKWWNCMDERHRKDTEECGSFPMRDLITRPAPFEDK